MSWDEVKKGRDVWPPDVEKILMQYYRAEYLDSKYFIIFKDRARLYHVLGEYEKSMEEYKKWYELGGPWKEEVTKEIELRKNEIKNNRKFSKITPWEYLQKYMSGDKDVDPSTKGRRQKSFKNKPTTFEDEIKRQKRKEAHRKMRPVKKLKKETFIVEKPKIMFEFNYDEQKNMESELIKKISGNKMLEDIFLELKNNLKILSNKKIDELIKKL
jgi:hypothetical protein